MVKKKEDEEGEEKNCDYSIHEVKKWLSLDSPLFFVNSFSKSFEIPRFWEYKTRKSIFIPKELIYPIANHDYHGGCFILRRQELPHSTRPDDDLSYLSSPNLHPFPEYSDFFYLGNIDQIPSHLWV